MSEIELGMKVKDTVTGFTGITTCRYVFLNGCVRWLVEAGKPDGSGIEELAFDDGRLEVIKKEPVEHVETRTGGARPTPPRTGAK